MQKLKDLILKGYTKFTGSGALAPKRFVISFIVIFFLILVICAAMVCWIDPYMRYHRAVGVKQVYRTSEAMIPGVMRHFEYDAVLFGSSMTQNFDINEINEILNCRSIKATSAGLDSESLDKYLATVTRVHKKELKRCMIGIDLFSFARNARPRWKDYHYLYDDEIFTPEYFFSIDTAKAIGEVIVSNFTYNSDPVAHHQMQANKMFSNKPGIHKYGKKFLEYDVTMLRPFSIPVDDEMVKNFENHLFHHIRNNPDVQFDVFLPPYSVYFWCYLKEYDKFDKLCELRDRFAEGVLKYPNVKLHDFHSDFSISRDLDNYKDLTHYSPAINTLILKKLASGEEVVSDLNEFRKRTGAIRAEQLKYYDEYRRLRALNPGRKARRRF